MKSFVIALLFANASAVKLSKHHRQRKASSDEDFNWISKSRPDGYNTSPYTQEQIKSDRITKFWEDHANNLDYTHSDNLGDRAPHKHPMGFTFAQRPVQQWTDGNGGGSEKVDYWHHLDKEHQNTEKFHNAAAAPWLPAAHKDDTEPKGNPLGPKAFGPNSIAQSEASAEAQAQWWHDGNGGGTEKWDAFEENARFSKNQDEFLKKVAQQSYLPSNNQNDAEPKGHPMGVYNIGMRDDNMQPVTSTAQTQSKYWGNGNGSGTEKWDIFEETARFSDSQDDFHKKIAQQPYLSSNNQDDAEPTGHPMGIHNLMIDQDQLDKDYETGATSDANRESMYWSTMGLQSENEKDFFMRARKPHLASFNDGDAEPDETKGQFFDSGIKW